MGMGSAPAIAAASSTPSTAEMGPTQSTTAMHQVFLLSMQRPHGSKKCIEAIVVAS
jgi:hypothetical protein